MDNDINKASAAEKHPARHKFNGEWQIADQNNVE
jgi:hypothetical protein